MARGTSIFITSLLLSFLSISIHGKLRIVSTQLADKVYPVTTSRYRFNPANPSTNPGPIIITIPRTSSATYTPTNPVVGPGTVTPTTPYAVISFPPAFGNVPVASPNVTTMPPCATSAPVILVQSWCIAKRGALESALQTALDYACGIGGVDCSMIQPGASCYNPNTVENHASYAFNIYFQKNPVPSSCDFGGTAMLINTNPSSGSCINPSLVTSPVTTPPPTTIIPPPPTASISGATGSLGSPPPPLLLSTSNQESSSSAIYGSGSPSALNSTTSGSTHLQPFINNIILISMFTFLYTPSIIDRDQTKKTLYSSS